MKTILFVLALGILILFMMTGCIPDNAQNNEASTSDLSASEAEEQPNLVEEEVEIAPAVIEPCPVSFGEHSYRRNSIGNEGFYVQITNNSDRPVKEVFFAVVFWDKDNLPVRVQFGYDEYGRYAYYDAMAPGETTSLERGWEIYNESGKDIVYSEIVVQEVVFFEGENWVNINFDKELEQYVGKIRKE